MGALPESKFPDASRGPTLEADLPKESSQARYVTLSLTASKPEPGELPGGPVVRTWHFHCRGLGSVPGRGTKIL